MEDLLYKALMQGKNKNIAREEYLTAAGKKEAARFRVRENTFSLQDVFRDLTLTAHIEPVKEGYLEILIESGCDFIAPLQTFVQTDKARDGVIDVPFTVKASKLHNGKNFGLLTFKTVYQEETVPVTVDMRISLRLATQNPRCVSIKITKGYLDFRMGKISLERWQEDVSKCLGEINGNTPEDLFFLLYRAHVNVISGKEDDPENILEYVSAQLSSREDYSAELFAYFLYVKSLYEKNEKLTRRAFKNIKELYEASPSWELLWICFYMDERYASNPAKKLLDIRHLFNRKKCSSPVMYFEAWDTYRGNPDFVNTSALKLNLQIFNFALKNSILEVAPVLRLSQQLFNAPDEELSEISIRVALNILKAAFDRYPVSSLSNTIARLLIAEGNKDAENHIYFERAVFDYAGIPQLFSYYFHTLDKTKMPRIPERLLKHFSQDASALGECRPYFFANIITNRYESLAYRNAYEQCLPRIEALAYESGAMGKNDEILSIIYSHILTLPQRDTQKVYLLLKAAFVQRVLCPNKQMRRVVVIHEEFSARQEVPLEDGCSYVSIYSPRHIILFKDRKGNIYKNIEYETVSFGNTQQVVHSCIKDVSLSAFMLTGDTLDAVRKNKSPKEVLTFLLSEAENTEFTKEYKHQLTQDLFEYYSKESVTDELYALLMKFLKEDIGEKSRALLIELMIETRHFDEAADEIRRAGLKGVKAESLRKLTHVLVQLKGEEERELLKSLTAACLESGSADTEILRYMCRFCEGSLKLLELLYKKTSEKGIYNLPVAERILCLCTGEASKQAEDMPQIFAACYKDSSQRELIHNFLESRALAFLQKRQPGGTFFFEYIVKDLMRGIHFCNAGRAALLVYMKDKDEISAAVLKMLKGLLEGLVNRGIMLEEFREYERFFEIPSRLASTHIVSLVNTACAGESAGSGGFAGIRVNYKIISDKGETGGSRLMREILPGVMAAYFTLFFGERLVYGFEGGASVNVNYAELSAAKDGSRYSLINEAEKQRLSYGRKVDAAALEELYIKDKLIKTLF